MGAWTMWLTLPLGGALIGWVTNWLAIRMLFHPRQRRWGMQGLLPRRQDELASSIGRIVADELLTMDELLAPLAEVDIGPLVGNVVDRVLQDRLADLQRIPLLGAFITPDRFGGLRELAVQEAQRHRGAILDAVARTARERIDVAGLVSSKIATLDLERLEDLVHRVARTEFRAIEVWGAVLGALVGLANALLLALMSA